MIDSGRAAVHAAEEVAFGGTDVEDERPLAELVAVAATVTAGGWWRRAGGPPVHLAAGRANSASSCARAATAGGPVDVRLAAGQHTQATIAHELAHALAGVGHGHDATFRAAHIDVCAVVAGGRASAHLAAAYRAFGLPLARRGWPTPVRVAGDGFLVVP